MLEGFRLNVERLVNECALWICMHVRIRGRVRSARLGPEHMCMDVTQYNTLTQGYAQYQKQPRTSVSGHVPCTRQTTSPAYRPVT